MPNICAIVPAAGSGIRMGKERPKQFLELAGKPILLHTLETLVRSGFISSIFAAVPESFLAATESLIRRHFHHSENKGFGAAVENNFPARLNSNLSFSGDDVPSLGKGCAAIKVIQGGVERQDSVYNALKSLPPDCEWVVVHDGVRPFVSMKLLRDALAAAQDCGACIAALPATDTVKRAVGGRVVETLARDEIWLVQTPQVFRSDIIIAAYREASKNRWQSTDDASLVERLGVQVAVVPGERTNIKITTPEDLDWACWFLDRRTAEENEHRCCTISDNVQRPQDS